MDGWLETSAALAAFALTTSITPGPNNLLLLDTGARHGFRRGLPVLVGIQVGFLTLLVAAHSGMGTLLAALPGLQSHLAWLCGAYLAWLAWKTLQATRDRDSRARDGVSRAPRWYEGAALQLVNPKAWGMALAGAGIAASVGAPSGSGAATLVAVFAVVGVPSSFTWLVGGAALRPLLSDVRRQRDFNAFMATLLLSTAVWIVWSGAGQGGP